MSKFAFLLPAAGGTAAAGTAAASTAGGILGTGITVGEVLTAGGTLLAASGAIQAGKQAERDAALQSEILRREAQQEQEQSESEAADFAKSGRRLLARQRALAGASGTQIGTGSFLDLSEDTAGEIDLQRLKILSGGDITSSRLLTSALFERQSGKQERRLGNIRGGSILLRGAGQLFGA